MLRLSLHPETDTAPPLVLTGYAFAGTVRKSPSAASVTATMAIDGLVPLDESAAGDTVVNVSISEETTSNMPPGVYTFDIFATPPDDGGRFCALDGTIRIEGANTR